MRALALLCSLLLAQQGSCTWKSTQGDTGQPDTAQEPCDCPQGTIWLEGACRDPAGLEHPCTGGSS